MSLALMAPIAPVAVPLVAHAATCSAQPPGAYPNDPMYAAAENGQAGQTWDGEAWYLYDCIPQDVSATSSDPEGAAGMSVSALWNRTAGAFPYADRGRNDVVVSYMEGGVNWRIPTSCELKDRALLNTGELPWPEDASGTTHATYDLNGDGVVNVEDYLNDPRVLAAVASQPKSPAGGPFLHHVCSGVGAANGSGYAPTDI
ncbi:MAG TPA: hypothetical protein VEY89_00115, partial [Candidatus Dormibacteraeota bacterium]|nr:hypothetical protein [Candidatus Dormibacteraeota bacterium]